MTVDQLSLGDWSRPKARGSDPWTSGAAARSITPGHTERKIEEVLDGCPMTDDEIAACFPAAHPPTIKTARSRLYKAGRVEPIGSRVNSRGREMLVWAIVENPCV